MGRPTVAVQNKAKALSEETLKKIVFISVFISGPIFSQTALATICDRSPAVVSHFEWVTKKTCADIDQQDLDQIKETLFYGHDNIVFKDGDFDGLNSLIDLGFKFGSISHFSSKIFSNLTSLKKLRFIDTELKHLPDDLFQGLESVEKISIWNFLNNNLVFPEGLFRGLNSLRSISVVSPTIKNPVIKLPESIFQNLEELEVLEIHGLIISDNTIHGLKKLKKLELYSNGLTQLNSILFRDLMSLDSLKIVSQKFSEVQESIFEKLINLNELYLVGTNVSQLPENIFKNLVMLKALNISENRIEHLSESLFKGLTALEKLDFASNRIVTLPDHIFKDLIRLHTLKLDSGLFLTKAYQDISKSLGLNVPLYELYIRKPFAADLAFTLSATILLYSSAIHQVEVFTPQANALLLRQIKLRNEPIDQIYSLYSLIPHADDTAQIHVVRQLAVEVCSLVSSFCPTRQEIHGFPIKKHLDEATTLYQQLVVNQAAPSTIQKVNQLILGLQEFFAFTIDYQKLRSKLPSDLHNLLDSYFSISQPTLKETADVSLFLHQYMTTLSDPIVIDQYVLPILKVKSYLSTQFKKEYSKMEQDHIKDMIPSLMIMSQAENLLFPHEVVALQKMAQQGQIEKLVDKAIEWQLSKINHNYQKNLVGYEKSIVRKQEFFDFFNYQVKTSLLNEWDKLKN